MNNVVIKCESEEHGKEIKKYFEDNGFDVGYWNVSERGYYYGVVNGEFTALLENEVILNNIKIITLPKSNLTFPREMLVWDSEEDDKTVGIVECYLPNLEYKYWIKGSSEKYKMIGYKNASEIEEPKIKEVTMEDLEKHFGTKVKIIK